MGVGLTGHLTLASLKSALAEADAELRRGQRVALLVDCREMTGYDGDARAEFVRWNSARRLQLRAVAVVTEKALWHVVVSAMALATRQNMKAFDRLESAQRWLVRQRSSPPQPRSPSP